MDMRRLLDILFPPRTGESALRGVSSDDFLALLAPQVARGTRPETVALLPFSAPPVRAAIHEAKYHRSEEAFRLLAGALTEYLRDDDQWPSRKCLIVPIPLGALRQKERGYNQAEEIAVRAIKNLSGFTVDTALLARTRETASQVSLPRRKRKENMRGAFKAVHGINPSYTYILLDDVLTTGATLQAAIDALTAAGAATIIPLALAH
jgi:Predicted amidophosphoribosyltransferases